MPSLGIDIVQITRIETLFKKYNGRFKDRVFTRSEQDYCEGRLEKSHSYAARWAAKEAFIKAFTSVSKTSPNEGERDFLYTDIEINLDSRGIPCFNLLSTKIRDIVQGKEVLLSVSHDKDYAVACVLII